MTIYLFTGPTLPHHEAMDMMEDIVVLPPVTQGDVYCAAREKPWGIGIIDGYFERVPAVWHKEILWALSQGVHVYGSSSMGALRAVELAAFGMKGVGRIFEAYHTGELEDDDEVTVVHGPGEDGYHLSSDAMVNIRATFQKALEHGVLDRSGFERLISIAKETHYPDRYYANILMQANLKGLSERQQQKLKTWLPDHQVDQKKLDAIEMLQLMKKDRHDHPQAVRVAWHFQHTDAWEQVQCRVDHRPLDRQVGNDTFETDAALVELKLLGKDYAINRLRATNRAMARELARQNTRSVGEKALTKAVETFRLEHGLIEGGSTEEWLKRQGLRIDEFDRLMREEVGVQRIEAIFAGDINRIMSEYLKLKGTFATWEDRAKEKHQLLASYGLENPGLQSLEISEEELWQWYFGEFHGLKVPQNLATFAEEFGFETEHELLRAVIREWWYLKLKKRQDAI